MRRLLPVLLLISACSQERTPPVSPAGFTLTRIVPTKSPLSVIEAKPKN